jgi:putative peptidoglycan lipid II flippase
MFMLAGPMLATLFQYGEFTAADTRMASLSLMAYSVALVGFTLVKVLSPGYFSRQDIRTPVRVSIRAVVVNVVLNLVIVVPMILLAIPGAHAGLAAATGLAAIYNASALYRGLRSIGVYVPGDGWRPLAFRVLPANLAMGLVLWLAAGPLDVWLELAWHARSVRLAGCIVLGLVVYLVTLLALGMRPSQLRSRPGAPAPRHSV